MAGRIAFLGNYIPRCCGIATFTNHLWTAVNGMAGDAQCVVVAVNDREEGYDYPPEVKLSFGQRDLDGYVAAAHALNRSGADVLCVQHVFGIYGGPAGGHVVSLQQEIRLPVVTTLHTVLSAPDAAQRKVMDALVRRSDRLVVMARKGREILRDVYGAEESVIEEGFWGRTLIFVLDLFWGGVMFEDATETTVGSLRTGTRVRSAVSCHFAGGGEAVYFQRPRARPVPEASKGFCGIFRV